MRIHCRYKGIEKIFDKPCEAVVLGRPRQGVHVDIDLSPDLRVSRPHARISFADGQYWVEDLGSANGTELDGEQIKGKGKLGFEPGQIIRISDTTIKVESPVDQIGLEADLGSDDKTLVTTRLDIDALIDASAPVFEAG